ncbi:MAG: lipid IV(A) 4-amino-4-deoxy-L-arabinosyltransferase [Phycisphaeraceae bacterium]
MCLLPIWFSLGDHPFYGRSDGRYAAVSRAMADGGNWLVPHLMGHPHLTKPPLTYWLEAGCMRLLGVTELAARLPSAIAGSLTVLLLFGYGCRRWGGRVGLLAAGTLAMMPLFITINRVTTTDALLSFCWFATLAAGQLAVRTGRWRYAIGLWFAVALGLMTKGPVAWIPLGLLVVWLAGARRWSDFRRLHLVTGLIVSSLPLLAWAAAVWKLYPDAAAMWYQESIGRIGGAHAKHAQPFWYYIPIFMGGLFPATAMMMLPGINIPWTEVRAQIRRGTDATLWALAVVLPFVIFSLISGKLATYILPLCAPLALLNALMLERWLTRSEPPADTPIRLPEVANTLFVCLTIITLLVFALLYFERSAWMFLSLILAVLMVLAAYNLKRIWLTQPVERGPALGLVFACYIVMVCGLLEIEDDILSPFSNRQLVTFIHEETNRSSVPLVSYGIGDQSLAFYADRVLEADSPEELAQAVEKFGDELVLIIEPEDWERMTQENPALAQAYFKWREWHRGVSGEVWWLMMQRRPATQRLSL